MRKASFIFLSWLIPVASWGQSADLMGKVTDQENVPLEGVHILHVGHAGHAHTNFSGQFILPLVHVGDTLLISHVGYQQQWVVVQDPTDRLSISMKEDIVSLREVVVSSGLDAIHLFSDINLKTNPVNSSQEILRQMPGVVIGQHAGGGKAEQIFLRGFDIDHGTDINITVDGLPVNMVSHAHGQGYADLHWLIPETVEQLDFGKGPYYAQQGNFTTAGYVNFRTYERLENSQIKLEAGQFNTRRMLGMFNLLDGERHHAYLASEYRLTDGPFESPQNFNRLNLLLKYTGRVTPADKVSITASHFNSAWDASGQIPQRAVSEGLISRFGAIDDTEGGNTSRTNVSLQYTRQLDAVTTLSNQAYLSWYDFQLFSNFTFFLNDPIQGDQIMQYEDRQLYGISSELTRVLQWGALRGHLQAGAGLRADHSMDNELSRTANRTTTLETIQWGDVREANLYGYLNAELEWGNWTLNPALRVDQFDFQYWDRLSPVYSVEAATSTIVSPKLNLLYNPNDRWQLYLKTGRGFHSNDTRVVVAQNGRETLPAALGSDLGAIWKPSPVLLVNAAYWVLHLEQEFVYVGDEGIVEPSGQTLRQGVDVSLRAQPVPWLLLNGDVNYTLARAYEEPVGSQFIPLAPDLTVLGSAVVNHPSGVFGGAQVRYLKNRPANEDNSIVAEGYTVVDANAGYEWRQVTLNLSVQNVFNTAWNETQFATESRMFGEAEAVEEIHFTPGTPFFFQAALSYKF
ncbi:MAG TPA: TonB-dependent receptor [Cytophagales bacterium]|nr:TonB-dependent receptor [Cytophagales bacterium]HAP59337.1 TonB-dependent receptor [Cytophagales bacterium]